MVHGRSCENVGGDEKVWEDVRKGEKSLEKVRDGERSCEKVGCCMKVWEDARKVRRVCRMLEMVGGVVRRLDVVRRFGKMLEKVRSLEDVYRWW